MNGKILTLTTNLLAETTLDFPNWQVGRTHRATGESFQVGGKGINVVRMLARLQAPATALCFPGGQIGHKCEDWLSSTGVDFQAFPTPLDTRIGTVVRTPGQPETTFLGMDCRISPASVRTCCDYLSAQPTGTRLALCGSIQAWDSPLWDPLREELRLWQGHQFLAADTYGPPLRWLAELGLPLIKLNRVEFSTLMGSGQLDPKAVPDALRTAGRDFQVGCWVVSDGSGPLWFMERGGEPESLQPEMIEEISPTGSGDLLFAGILDGLLNRGFGLRQSVALGCRLATASAARPGIADFPDTVIADALK
ncbi:MAG: PfkB family carbohydrate kinase [Opitutaceae bacterium]